MCLPLLDQCPLCYGLQPARAAALEVIHQPRLRDSPGATGTGEVVDHQVVYLPATAEAHRRKRDPMSFGSARTVAPELNIGGDRPVCSCVAAFPGQQEVAYIRGVRSQQSAAPTWLIEAAGRLRY